MKWKAIVKQIEETHGVPAKEYIAGRLGEGASVAELADELGTSRGILYYQIPRLGILLERSIRIVGEEV